MGSKWIKGVPPQMLNDQFGLYRGVWMKEMDRCWLRESDGTCVCSRLIRTNFGLIEHVTLTRSVSEAVKGNYGFSWAEKQEIKNELFGKERMIRGLLDRREEYTREQAEEWFIKKYAAQEEQIRLFSKYLADYKPIEERTVFQHYHSIAPWSKGYEIVICEGEELGKWSDVGEKAIE